MSKKKSTAVAEKIEVTEEQTIAHPMQSQIDEIVNSDTSKSQKIRKLWVLFGSDNKARSLVAKVLNIRYQHVRNVLITPLKKG